MEKKVGMFLKTKIGYYIEKFPKIAVKHFCMPSSFCPLEVTFLKIANVIYCVAFFSVCLFDAEQHVTSSSQLNKTLRLVILLILVNY